MDRWDGAFLNGRGCVVSRKLDVAKHDGVEARIFEAFDQLYFNGALLGDLDFGDPKQRRQPGFR